MTEPSDQKTEHWDKLLVQKLKGHGLSHEHAMIAVTETAELNQNAYCEGYSKGYLEGFKAAEIKYKPVVDHYGSM